MSIPVLENASFPGGKWKIHYERDIDRYRITTEYNDFIADVGPTLVAYWLVQLYNSITWNGDEK